MGKGAKSRARAQRAARKRMMKNSNKAKYESWKREGMNTKSKRAKLHSKRKKMSPPVKHTIKDCGNLGCKRCHPPKFVKAPNKQPVLTPLERYKRRITFK